MFLIPLLRAYFKVLFFVTSIYYDFPNIDFINCIKDCRLKKNKNCKLNIFQRIYILWINNYISKK